MRDQVTHLGTQSMCALYKPDTFPTSLLQEQGPPLYGPCATAGEQPSSNSGSEAEWDPDLHAPKHGKGCSPEQNRLKVRDKGRTVQRRWRQKYKVRDAMPAINQPLLFSRQECSLWSDLRSVPSMALHF